jgi:hypothetical protein
MKIKDVARLIVFTLLVITFGSPMASAREKSHCKKSETAYLYRVAWQYHQHNHWTSKDNADAVLKAVRQARSVSPTDYWLEMKTKKVCSSNPAPPSAEKH